MNLQENKALESKPRLHKSESSHKWHARNNQNIADISLSRNPRSVPSGYHTYKVQVLLDYYFYP
jgi:hypothetical protein